MAEPMSEAMNKSPQSHLFRVVAWIATAGFFLLFGVYFHISGASFTSGAHVLTAAVVALIEVGLICLGLFLSRLPAMRRLSRVERLLLCLVAMVLLESIAGYFSGAICQEFAISPRFWNAFICSLPALTFMTLGVDWDRKPGRTLNQAPDRAQN